MKAPRILLAIACAAAAGLRLDAVIDPEPVSGPRLASVGKPSSRNVPACRPRPATETKKQEPMEKTYAGILKVGIMAIGGETTGVILETDAGTYELDLRANPEADEKADGLHGKKVVVTGEYRPRPGVEVRERRIIVVRTLREAP